MFGSCQDLTIDCNELLIKFLGRIVTFLETHFPIHSDRIACLRTLYSSGLSSLLDFVISNEEQLNKWFTMAQLEQVVRARFEETKLRKEILS